MPFKFGEVDSLDAVPAEFKSVYSTTANANGKFEVAEAHKAIVAAYSGNATALETERGKVTNLNKENADRRGALKPFEDLVAEFGITPETGEDAPTALKRHVGDLTSKVKGGEAFKGNLEQIKQAAEQRIAALTTEKDKELGAMRTTLEEYLIDKEALAALGKAKAKNGGTILLPHVKQNLKVVKTEDGKYTVRAVDGAGQVRYNNAAQFMGVEDIITEVKADPNYAFAFESESSGGTGTQPGGSKTPVIPPGGKVAGDKSSTQKISEGLSAMQKTGATHS